MWKSFFSVMVMAWALVIEFDSSSFGQPTRAASPAKVKAAAKTSLPLPKRQSGPEWQPLKMRLTAYCNEGPSGCRICCGKWAPHNKTASGKTPRVGMVAADSKLLPFGSRVKIPELGEFVVEDTGSAIKGPRLDIFFGTAPGSHQRALEFGVKNVTVWVRKK
jgi:3D (Asp-Asp-Asp) domain-containing protein